MREIAYVIKELLTEQIHQGDLPHHSCALLKLWAANAEGLFLALEELLVILCYTVSQPEWTNKAYEDVLIYLIRTWLDAVPSYH